MAPKPVKNIPNLPKELHDLVIDTADYDEKTDSTKLLEILRYGTRPIWIQRRALQQRIVRWLRRPCLWCGKSLHADYVQYHPGCLEAKARAKRTAH